MEIEQEDEKEKERKNEAEETIIPSFSFFDKITNCHSDTITSISFTSSNSQKKLLATGSNDKFIKIFDKNINFIFGVGNWGCNSGGGIVVGHEFFFENKGIFVYIL